jgi:hypothetical protein
VGMMNSAAASRCCSAADKEISENVFVANRTCSSRRSVRRLATRREECDSRSYSRYRKVPQPQNSVPRRVARQPKQDEPCSPELALAIRSQPGYPCGVPT